MTADRPLPVSGRGGLGQALRRAIAGYRQQVEQELAAAGFTDWHAPDGRVLRICASAEKVTISDIGRKLNITRQGASKLVAGLRERDYLTVSPSPIDGREKVLALTPRAVQFLIEHYKAANTIEIRLRSQLGEETVDQLFHYLEIIAGDNADDPDEIPPLRAIRWRERYDPL